MVSLALVYLPGLSAAFRIVEPIQARPVPVCVTVALVIASIALPVIGLIELAKHI
jgi:hypothetical protein